MELEEFFKFGKNEPINRLAYTKADADYKLLIMQKMQEMNMKIFIDKCGNIAGIRGEGKKPYIVLGSHTDSVPNGGQYDGPVGVVSALMAANNFLQNNSNVNGTLVLAIYACEESSRFKQACIGSRYLSGELKQEDFLRISDENGILLIDAIEDFRQYIEENRDKYGIGNIEYVNKIFSPNKIDAALEMHIEQYQIMHRAKKQIGIVNSIVSPVRGTIEVFGKRGHSGTTPMNERRDAVRAAAQFIEQINKLAEKPNSNFRVTFPKFETPEWSANVIQDKVNLFMDIRQQIPLNAKETIDMVYNELKRIATKSKVNFSFKVESSENPTKTDEKINKQLEDICIDKEIDYTIIPAWAGHDTAHLNNSTLVFIPSTGGSHNKEENAVKENIETAIELYSEYLKERLQEKNSFVEKVDIDYSSIGGDENSEKTVESTKCR